MNARIGGAKMYDGLLDAMQAAGLGFKGSIVWNSNKVERYRPDGDEKSSSKHAWYLAHDDERGVCVTFGSWREGSQHTWFPAGQKKREISDEERQRIESAKREAEAERKAAYEVARRKAVTLWESLPTSGESPYLQRKNVASYGLRYAVNIPRESFGWDPGSTLTGVVVPGYKIGDDGTLIIQTLQIIFSDGGKFFFRGAEQKGACHIIGALSPETKRILLCEGYSTAATLHEATGLPVVCAFNAGNLVAVAKTIRKRYPNAMLTVCGDDDRWHEPGAKNAGREAAFEAVAETGCGWVLPTFPEGAEGEPTDFNDLAALRGLPEVRRQVLGEVAAPVIDTGDNETDGDDAPQNHALDIDWWLRNYFPIDGTTDVWSLVDYQIKSAASLKENYPSTYKLWKVSEAKVVIGQSDIAFAPDDKEKRVRFNLFRGLTMKARKGNCDLIINLARQLCGGDDEVFDWLMKWLAYPLQNLGAKMDTAVVVHGEKVGTGKNTLFDHVMCRIYGEYGNIIGQEQLTEKYNAWISKKLFVVANEVLDHATMNAMRGKLKAMITDRDIQIRDMHRAPYRQRNYANIVFLSNDEDRPPVPAELNDRRYTFILSDRVLSQSQYDAVYDQIDNKGGVAAFYQFLLDYDLGDFNPHTKPLDTAHRDAILDDATPSHQRFIREWLAGETPYPVEPSPTSALYEAYRQWCSRNGYTAFNRTRFGTRAGKMLRRSVRVRFDRFMEDSGGGYAPAWIVDPDAPELRSEFYVPEGFEVAALNDRATASDHYLQWQKTLLREAAVMKRLKT